jgi:hypothetical protein
VAATAEADMAATGGASLSSASAAAALVSVWLSFVSSAALSVCCCCCLCLAVGSDLLLKLLQRLPLALLRLTATVAHPTHALTLLNSAAQCRACAAVTMAAQHTLLLVRCHA